MLQEEDNVKDLSYDETYNLIEYAEGGPYHHCNFKTVTDMVEVGGKDDCYHSVFLHSGEIKKYSKTHFNDKGKPSIEKYEGAVWAKELIIDFDIEKPAKQEDLNLLLGNLRLLLRQIENKYDLDLRYIRINFSGHKGFHIRIPAVLFGGFTPSVDLPSQMKQLAQELTDGMRLDTKIYHRTFYIRYVNSRNSKSGLCAIPLSSEEIFSLSIEEIKILAASPRDVDYISVEELEPVDALVSLKEERSSKTSRFTVDLSKVDITEGDSIWLGVVEGERNKTLPKIVGPLVSRGQDPETIIAIAKLWNLQCRPPEEEKILVKHTLSMIKDFSPANGTFWSLNNDNNVFFNKVKYRKFLEGEGFGKIYFGKNLMFVKIQNKRISEVSVNQIKDHVLEQVRARMNNELIEEALLQKNNISLLAENLIECISTVIPNEVRDSKNAAYFYFDNCFIEVTKEGVLTHYYEKLNGYIWQSQTIGKDVKIEASGGDFEKFIFNVAGKDPLRFRAFQSAIGYLLHSYKDSSNAKVVVLCDQVISDYPDGRTGKSILGKAISKMRKAVREEGKNYEFNRFAFQLVELDTEILEFNDVKKDFDFEQLFSVITDDMTVENKRLKPFIIPFEKSPKILVSTNYTIKGQGGSFRDRLYEIEFSDHYSESHRPVNDFGRLFFDDWDDMEWNKFFNFMFQCVRLYLNEGLIYAENINLTRRKIIDATCRQFEEFISGRDLSQRVEKRSLFDEFKLTYPELYGIRQNSFTKWIKNYASIKGLKVLEERSDGKDYISLKV